MRRADQALILRDLVREFAEIKVGVHGAPGVVGAVDMHDRVVRDIVLEGAARLKGEEVTAALSPVAPSVMWSSHASIGKKVVVSGQWP